MSGKEKRPVLGLFHDSGYFSGIHTGTQVAHLLYFDCKIGDFICLQKKFIYLLSYKVFFGDFLNYALKTN